MKEYVEIKDAQGEPIWYARISNSCINLEYESYGFKDGGPNIESDVSIPSSEYPKIREHFGYERWYPIGDLLQELSDAGRGQEFKTWANKNLEIKVNDLWFSFNDD